MHHLREAIPTLKKSSLAIIEHLRIESSDDFRNTLRPMTLIWRKPLRKARERMLHQHLIDSGCVLPLNRTLQLIRECGQESNRLDDASGHKNRGQAITSIPAECRAIEERNHSVDYRLLQDLGFPNELWRDRVRRSRYSRLHSRGQRIPGFVRQRDW
jgi:hypothetical protein